MKSITTALVLLILISTQALSQGKSSNKEDFLKMAEYLSAESGEWMTANPNYDPQNQYSVKGFGLWFELKLNNNLLHLTHAVYRGDTATVTGESFWLWHPGEQRIKYYSINFRGGHTNGETYFESTDKFVTSEYNYGVDGSISRGKDENWIISNKGHRTITSRFKTSAWTEEGVYNFELVKKGSNYKVIKHQ